MRTHHACLVLAVAALAAASRPAHAEVIELPPLIISQLTHQYVWDFESGDSWVDDFVAIPGTGYTCGGFTAAFGTGDVVQVRIAPPPGKKFRLLAPGGSSGFGVIIGWPLTGGGPGVSHFNPFTYTFENPTGLQPTLESYTLVAANESAVSVWLNFQAPGDFEFTAFRVDITVDQALAKLPRTYDDVQGLASPAISGSKETTDPNLKIFEIIPDTAVPSLASSWGRLKSLYR